MNVDTTIPFQSKIMYEYIWIDGNNQLRSKVKVVTDTALLQCMTIWNFDGSSTGQSSGFKSDIILAPVFYCKDPFRIDSYLVLCDTYMPDGTVHFTNFAYECKQINDATKDQEPLFGFEQEYIIFDRKNNLPIGSNQQIIETGQDHYVTVDSLTGLTSVPFYCSVGEHSHGRRISEEHLQMCLDAELTICGTNAEVTIGQWEYQIGPLYGIEAAHQLWMSRFILDKVAEKHNAYISYHPKPYLNWNGSGCHTNFSTKLMREDCGYEHIVNACEKLSEVHQEHLAEYGDLELNKTRLTGTHETASHELFKYGVSDRGASIRIPLNVYNAQSGYLEDRRPGSHCDPYRVITRMLKTVCL